MQIRLAESGRPTITVLPQYPHKARLDHVFGLRFPCVARSAGWNSTAAQRVVASDSAINFPMLDVPGWWENQRLPKAVAVVQALNRIARVSGDCKKFVSPARHAMI